MSEPLDRDDLRLALAAVKHHLSVYLYIHKPTPPGLADLPHRIEAAMSARRQEPVAAPPEWMTTAQAAQRYGGTRRTWQRKARKCGKRIGRDWLIPVNAVEDE